MPSQDVIQWIRFVSASIPAANFDSTVAIVASNRPTLLQLGTGTLFRIADQRFLVTAAHVATEASKRQSTLGITGSVDGRFIALGGTWSLSGSEEDGHYPFDVALYEFRESESKQISDKKFLSLADVGNSENLNDSIFVVCGFPQVWSAASDESAAVQLKPLQLTSYTYDGDTVGLDVISTTVVQRTEPVG